MGRFVAEAFSGTVVEAIHREFDVFRCNGFESPLFREELSDEAVHFFVGTAFLGGIGMCKEEICAELLGDLFVLSEFPAVIGRHRVNRGCKRGQQGNYGR